jgi:hypothetical protein
MNKYKGQPIKQFCYRKRFLLGMAISLAMVSGCTENGSAPPVPGVGIPGSATAVKTPLATTNKNRETILEIALASKLLCNDKQCVNPFLNKLPKALVVSAEGPTDAAVPEVDPFGGFSLLGVVFNPSSATALVSLAGGESGTTRLVRKGDVVPTNAGEIRIAAIGRDYIEVETVGAKSNKQTFNLPSVLEYESQKRGQTNTGNTAPLATEPTPSVPTSDRGIIGNMMDTLGSMGGQQKQVPGKAIGNLIDGLQKP